MEYLGKRTTLALLSPLYRQSCPRHATQLEVAFWLCPTLTKELHFKEIKYMNPAARVAALSYDLNNFCLLHARHQAIVSLCETAHSKKEKNCRKRISKTPHKLGVYYRSGGEPRERRIVCEQGHVRRHNKYFNGWKWLRACVEQPGEVARSLFQECPNIPCNFRRTGISSRTLHTKLIHVIENAVVLKDSFWQLQRGIIPGTAATLSRWELTQGRPFNVLTLFQLRQNFSVHPHFFYDSIVCSCGCPSKLQWLEIKEFYDENAPEISESDYQSEATVLAEQHQSDSPQYSPCYSPACDNPNCARKSPPASQAPTQLVEHVDGSNDDQVLAQSPTIDPFYPDEQKEQIDLTMEDETENDDPRDGTDTDEDTIPSTQPDNDYNLRAARAARTQALLIRIATQGPETVLPPGFSCPYGFRPAICHPGLECLRCTRDMRE